jgi:hypothetical protein
MIAPGACRVDDLRIVGVAIQREEGWAMARLRCFPTGLLAGLACAAFAYAEDAALRPATEFLTKEQAEAAIIDDKLEGYFEHLQPMEMAAKTGSPVSGATIEEKRNECRRRYQQSVMAFLEDERTAIRRLVDKVSPVLVRDYPLIGRIPFSFLKVSGEIEGGLPHTRGRHIVLSEPMCRSVVATSKLPPEQAPHIMILDLLVHEQVHVFQRLHPGRCDSLYTGVWGFEKARNIAVCRWLVEHSLVNPDAVECPWVLPVKKGGETSYLWPLVVFSEGKAIKRMPADFRMVAISLEKTAEGFAVQVSDKGKPVSRDLMRVPEFRVLFPMSTNIYHPGEASADMFGKIVVFDNFVPKTGWTPARVRAIDKHLAPLGKWFAANMKEPVGVAR